MQSDRFTYPTLLCSQGLNKTRAHTRYWGNRDDGVAVRALVSHQCGLGSSPGGDAIYGLNCCWFSILLRKVSLRVLQLLSSRQEVSLLKTMSQFQFDPESVSRWVHLEGLSFKRSWNCQVPPSLNNVSLVWFVFDLGLLSSLLSLSPTDALQDEFARQSQSVYYRCLHQYSPCWSMLFCQNCVTA